MHSLVIAVFIIVLLPLLSGHSYDKEPVSMDNDLEHSSTIYKSVYKCRPHTFILCLLSIIHVTCGILKQYERKMCDQQICVCQNKH